MKALKGLKALVALVLTLTFIALVPLNTVAAADTGKYVSEVYVAYGKDAEAAKKALGDKGFTPIEGNLNENGGTYVLMGYKTRRRSVNTARTSKPARQRRPLFTICSTNSPTTIPVSRWAICSTARPCRTRSA